MTRTVVALALVTLVTACDREQARAAPAARDVALHPQLGDATQDDFANELDEADRRGTWREVRQRWLGQRLRWTVTRHRLLCRDASACHVAAFPIQRPAQHGWLPALDLTPAELAKLDTACGTAEHCELEIEGTLGELVVSAELPTSLRFVDVKVLRARPS